MSVYQVPISKAGNATVDIQSDTLPEDMFRLVVAAGLKAILNAGMTKITVAKLEGEDLSKARAAALAKAEETAKALNEGTLKVGRSASKAKGVPGKVMTEARRLAKAVVKDEIRKAGMKISHVEASEITKAANALIEADNSFIEQATKNLAERETAPAKIDIKALVQTSPKLVEKAEKEKAERRAATSAKSAGKTTPRAKAGATRTKPTAQVGA